MVSVDWMGVIEGVVVKSFAVMGVTIYLSTTRYSNPEQKKQGQKPYGHQQEYNYRKD
jgi:hypothetical protein